LRRRLKRSDARVKRVLKVNRQSTKSGAPSEVTARELQLTAKLKTPRHLDRRTLHPYRLKVKELRYVLQLADRADQQRFVVKLGEVKDVIGEWHDWETLVTIAKKLLNHGRHCKLLRVLRAIGDDKYQSALALTNEMRRAYLSQESKPSCVGKSPSPKYSASSIRSGPTTF
jgi:CHAD domain-containing protein